LPRTCLTCAHPHRAEIDAAIVTGESIRSIANRFNGASQCSYFRHSKHAQAALLAGINARNAALTETLRVALDEVIVAELANSQAHRDARKDSVAKKGHITKVEWDEAIDGMFAGHLRTVSYIRRLLRDGANAGSPNSREGLMTGITGVGPRLRRVKIPKAETETKPTV